MIRIDIMEARQQLPALLSKVQEGEKVIITKRGEPVAKVIPFRKQSRRPFESHKAIRDAMAIKGKPLSELVAALRGERRS